jgi:hypothetical protein
MQLNLPIFEQLRDKQNILISGAGGGFDVFIGLPLYYTLREMGKTVHLANYSFSDLTVSTFVSECEVLIPDRLGGVYGPVKRRVPAFAEGYLAEWLHQTYHEDIRIWMLPNSGGIQLAEAYRTLTNHLQPDALILVDGGIDSLMRGDEERPGTLIEDALTLAAVDYLDIPTKILACLGMGTEVEESASLHHALENIAGLIKEGGFLGSCSLLPQMEAFKFYESACRYVWEQPNHPKSHISTRIIPAAHGEFGNFHMYPDDRMINLYISALMSMYLFFEVDKVIARNLITDSLATTYSKHEALTVFQFIYNKLKKRHAEDIPY